MSDRNLEIALRIKADLESARKQLDDLNKSVKATGDNSKASADKLSAVGQRIGEMEKEAATANKTLGQTGKVADTTAGKTKNLGSEVAQLAANLKNGNFTGAATNVERLGSASGVTASSMTALSAGVGLSVIALAAFVAIAIKGYLEAQTLDRALIATGNYAGQTGAQLRNLANDVGSSTGNYAIASDAVLLLAQSGRINEAAMGDAARAAVNMAALTGQSISQAVAAIVQLEGHPAQAVKALDDRFHFLTTTTYLQIEALREHGREAEADALTLKTLADALEQREQRDVANLGLIQRAYKSVHDEITRGIALIKQWGSQDLGQQLDQLYARRGVLETVAEKQNSAGSLLTGGLLPAVGTAANASRIAAIDAQIAKLKELQAQQEASAQAEGEAAQTNAAGNKGVDVLQAAVAQYRSAELKYADRVKELKAAAADALKAAPNNADVINHQLATALQGAKDAYEKSLPKTPRGRGAADTSGSAAAATDRAAANAQEQLIGMLANVQGQLDPTAAAWAKYNQEVDKANKAAEVALKGSHANVEGINAERTAYIDAAGRIRDAAIAKLAEADQKAWETLRDSLRTPTEVKIDTAVAAIAELNRLMASGVDLGGQYHATLARIGQNVVSPLPSYQGVDAAVGGPTSELAKNFQAQQDLEVAYATQSAELKKQLDDGDLANHEVYLAAKAKLDSDYAQKSTSIEQSRQQLTLTAMSGFFGQIATLQHSQNSKMAAIGKAAAIAQAIINTYQAATGAYAALAGIPYVGPFLGAAAAAVAVAAGLANVQQIRSQPTSFDVGGYTGPGGRLEPAGIVHKGEVVWSQDDVSRAGGVGVVEALRLGYPGYATGGVVETPRLQAPVAPRARMQDPADNVGAGPVVANNFRFISAFDANDLAQRILETPAGEKAVVNHVIANGNAVKQGIG